MFKHIYYQIKKLKTLESDKHNQPMFSVAAKKMTDRLSEFLEKNKCFDNKKEDERTPSILDSSFSSINTQSIMNNTLVKGQKASMNSLQYAP